MTLTELHELFLKYPLISTDTRKIKPHSIFFALKGPNFNGNAFAKEALKKGAAYAVVDEKEFALDRRCILFEDALETLQKLAIVHRNHCNARVISLTGSNGKTTTKELIVAVLSKKYRTIATVGNLNNHIGVPLTLLSIKPETEFAVVEMGANHLGEIAFLSGLAQPDFGYITNFGKAHLEGFGSIEGVIKGKSELYEYLISENKQIFLNADDPIQKKKLRSHIRKYGFSQNDPEYYTIEFLGANPHVSIKFENTIIDTNLIGAYNFTNCSAALLIGKYFNVPLEDIKNAIESYIPQNNRSQLIEKNGHHIILDAYNANPTSMEAALRNFATSKEANKLLFLGDMFELGETTAQEHQKIADLAKELGFSDVHLIGENFFKIKTDFMKFSSFEEVREYLKSNDLKPGHILIKGSRGMALERVVELL